jgi:mRNA interferase MazF
VRRIPSEVALGPEDGLPQPCAVNLDHVQTVSRGKLGALITTLPSGRMAEVREALLFALGF